MIRLNLIKGLFMFRKNLSMFSKNISKVLPLSTAFLLNAAKFVKADDDDSSDNAGDIMAPIIVATFIIGSLLLIRHAQGGRLAADNVNLNSPPVSPRR